ncbi:MAG: hypothetical protein H8E26_01300 [FCB group bacterium]|nr:hypothetical protein [FCB group bacterium]MBL7123141.1 hypothetical protein [Candidatus Neomarinimicrobiota bacterium]
MQKYLLLRNPGHNRVYYLESEKLALAELTLTARRFEQPCHHIESIDLAGINYLAFTVEQILSERELTWVSNLSFVLALFKHSGDEDHPTLQPVELTPRSYVDPKISMLLKYSGKTNEIFTRLMINVGLISSDFQFDDPVQMLDPVSGKGTTLFEGAIRGFDVTGIEMERKLVHETTIFFKRFLEQEKYKHDLLKNAMYASSAGSEAFIQLFEYARNKQDFKSESSRKHLAIIAGNAIHSRRYFKAEKFHLIIGDLPYGIAHGNVSQKKHNSRTRSPAELMETSLPEFQKILKTGGSLVLAWNTFVWPREDFVELLTKTGFQVLAAEPYDQFTHRVDQSIKRDIVVARKD